MNEVRSELFSNIIGYDDIKKSLKTIVDVLNNEEKYKNLGCNIAHGLLLYGSPGTGKTSIANEILENAINRQKYIIRKTKSDGEFMDYMNEVFSEAVRNQPSIILLDDLEKFAEDDSHSNQEEYVTVQSLIDGIKDDDVFDYVGRNTRLEIRNDQRLVISQMLAQPYEMIPEIDKMPWDLKEHDVTSKGMTWDELQEKQNELYPE